MNAHQPLDLEEVALSYLKSIDGGAAPDPSAWLARYPQFADELGLLFAWERRLEIVGAVPTPFSSLETAGSEGEPADGEFATERFELGVELGHGGMGSVRRAHDPVLNRQLAIKVLRSRHRHHPGVAARFLAEARIAAGLEHPGIAPVHDIGKTSDGRPFIAMKLIEGRTLAALLQERSSPEHDLPRFLKIFEQVAQTVAYAHSKGVMHRDLKPHNIMSGAFGEVQVMDWGLAKRIEAVEGAPVSADRAPVDGEPAEPTDDGVTGAGAIIGTPAYMAPEQARGEVGLLDVRADVFGLGAILCQILTGRPPFATLRPLEQARQGDLVDAFARLETCGCDPELSALAKRCLAPIPADRPANGQAVAEALAAYLSGVQDRLRQAELTAAKGTEVRKRRQIVMALMVLAVIGSAAAAFWLRTERDVARKSEEHALSADKERLQELYRAYLGEIRASRRLGSLGQRELGLKAIRAILSAFSGTALTDAQKAELRDEAIACLALSDCRETLSIPANIDGLYIPARTSDHGHFASWDEDSQKVVIRRLADGGPVKDLAGIKGDPERISYFFSSCGGWFAESAVGVYDASKHRLRVWDWRAERLVFDRPLVIGATVVAFHPHASKMVVSAGDHVLRRFDIESGRLEGTSEPQLRGQQIAFDPSGKMLAAVGHLTPAEIIDAETWQTLQTIADAGPATAVAWNPVEPYLLIGTVDGRLYLWNHQKRTGYFLSGALPPPIYDLHFTPDGRLLAVTTTAGIRMRYPEGDQVLTSMPGASLGFFANGRRLATVRAGKVVCYDVDALPPYRSIRGQAEYAVFSPDDRWLCLSGIDGVKTHDAHTLTEIGDLGLDHAGPVAFDPLMKELITFGLFSYPCRWPIEYQVGADSVYRFGPAQALGMTVRKGYLGNVPLPHYQGRHVAWSRDGHRCAIANYRDGQVLLSERGSQSAPQVFAAFPNAARVALSPDGQWVAAGAAIWGRGAAWRVRDKHKMLDRAEDIRDAQFSPDGRWLTMSTPAKVLLFKVSEPAFELARVIDRFDPHGQHATACAFHPGGRLLAMTGSASQILLIDLESGRTAASLTHPDDAIPGWLSFSGDGSRLAVTRLGLEVGIWDLARLRADLAELGLEHAGLPARPDEARPAPARLEIHRGQLPPPSQWADHWRAMAEVEASSAGDMPAAIRCASKALELVAHDRKRRAELLALRGHYQLQNHDLGGARTDWLEAVALAPDLKSAVLPLCRLYVLGPADLRDPGRAVALLAPSFVNRRAGAEERAVYGYAQILLGHYDDGLTLLKELPDDAEQPVPRYFEALAHARLSRRDVAEAAFKEATALHEQRRLSAPATTRDEWERVRADVVRFFK